MNRQFLLGAMMFLLVITGYNQFVALPRARAAQEAAEAQLKASAQQATKSALNPVLAGESVVTDFQTDSSTEELFVLDLPQAEITFSSQGAGIKKYLFKDVLGAVDLTPYAGEGYFATWPTLNFSKAEQTASSVVFQAKPAANVVITKTYQFNENGMNQLNIVIENQGENPLSIADWDFNFGPGLATVASEMRENEAQSKAVYLVQEEGKKKPTLEKFSKGDDQPTLPWVWAGIQNRYFLTALIPQGWKPGKLATDKQDIGTQKRFLGLLGSSKLTGPQLTISVPGDQIAARSKVEYKSDFFFGPKNYAQLLKLPYHLDRSIEFGFFGALGKLVRKILDTFYGWTGNYGLAIIMLAVFLQAILCKLTIMQFKSAEQMRKVQPEMKRLQEKYKNDREKMNMETLKLYQKYGVNPLSGCLPALVQLPIFLALFNALRTTWSLHGAGFMWWWTDLSSKDPYYVLPLLMGAMMYIQQKNSMPAGIDDTQAMMFKFMPIVFTIVFLNFPSGLVLYYLTYNIISFGIQTMLKRKMAKAN